MGASQRAAKGRQLLHCWRATLQPSLQLLSSQPLPSSRQVRSSSPFWHRFSPGVQVRQVFFSSLQPSAQVATRVHWDPLPSHCWSKPSSQRRVCGWQSLHWPLSQTSAHGSIVQPWPSLRQICRVVLVAQPRVPGWQTLQAICPSTHPSGHASLSVHFKPSLLQTCSRLAVQRVVPGSQTRQRPSSLHPSSQTVSGSQPLPGQVSTMVPPTQRFAPGLQLWHCVRSGSQPRGQLSCSAHRSPLSMQRTRFPKRHSLTPGMQALQRRVSGLQPSVQLASVVHLPSPAQRSTLFALGSQRSSPVLQVTQAAFAASQRSAQLSPGVHWPEGVQTITEVSMQRLAPGWQVLQLASASVQPNSQVSVAVQPQPSGVQRAILDFALSHRLSPGEQTMALQRAPSVVALQPQGQSSICHARPSAWQVFLLVPSQTCVPGAHVGALASICHPWRGSHPLHPPSRSNERISALFQSELCMAVSRSPIVVANGGCKPRAVEGML